MPTVGSLRVHRASIVSDAVPVRIDRAGSRAMHIQSVYRSVVNISTADGLLTIASPAGGGLPNGVLADLGPDWRTIGLSTGMRAVAGDRGIRIPDAGLEVEIWAVPRWSPRFRPSGTAVERGMGNWARRAPSIRALAGPWLDGGGLSPLPAGSGLVDQLRVALETDDRLVAAAAARRLIGLGPGLTPSGDDVLVGVEASLHAVADRRAGFLGLALGDLDSRTTELAATLLRHAAAGEFAERLQGLLAALLGPDDGAIPGTIERSVAWGATSGADCLAGVLLGLDVASAVHEVAA